MSDNPDRRATPLRGNPAGPVGSSPARPVGGGPVGPVGGGPVGPVGTSPAAQVGGSTAAQVGYAAPSARLIGRSNIVALVVSVLWVGVSALYLLVLSPEAGSGSGAAGAFLMTLMAVVFPVALLWVAAAAVRAVRTARALQTDIQRLLADIDQIRQAIIADRQVARMGGHSVERKLTEIAQAGRAGDLPVQAGGAGDLPVQAGGAGDVPAQAGRAGDLPAQAGRAGDVPQGTFATTREPPRRRAPPAGRPAEDQPSLALGLTGDETAPPLDRADLIRALNFPETDKDAVGFAALRRAMRDRRTRQLIQASQDVLTLLSQDGIYMDDLNPDRARPEIWRRFAQGERGRAVAALGGIRDRSCMALTTGRMRQDTIFRDAAHHFLRLFDKMLAAIEPEASDEDIARLAETRTARAFMLIGRVTGAFD